MGGRQSSVAEDRPRSNSVDTASAAQGGHDDHARNPSRSVMTAAEFLQVRWLRSHGGLSLNHARSGRLRGNLSRRSMPVFMMGRHFSWCSGAEDMTCPICHKTVPSDEADVHLVMCLTRPKITYNDDVLTEDKGECSICLEEMLTGAVIARLPCLCIYHKQYVFFFKFCF
ncbi:unnamed protein product [Nippostrongylus brasiliensis]|uniref:RING-type E3 ubiquitin transferase n=1 Tax=Nippostrongylus brasiliensis TaxID=27835 RepID=A0A0N4Y4X4_NIPBR|nr:unnamed protein product [Nippostrongylus brasiliensis]